MNKYNTCSVMGYVRSEKLGRSMLGDLDASTAVIQPFQLDSIAADGTAYEFGLRMTIDKEPPTTGRSSVVAEMCIHKYRSGGRIGYGCSTTSIQWVGHAVVSNSAVGERRTSSTDVECTSTLLSSVVVENNVIEGWSC